MVLREVRGWILPRDTKGRGEWPWLQRGYEASELID